MVVIYTYYDPPPKPPRLPARVREALRRWYWRRIYDRNRRAPPDLKLQWDAEYAASLIG